MKLSHIALCLICLSITGCSPESDMQKAQNQYACRELGGLYQMGGIMFKTICNDGVMTTYKAVPLPKGGRVGDNK